MQSIKATIFVDIDYGLRLTLRARAVVLARCYPAKAMNTPALTDLLAPPASAGHLELLRGPSAPNASNFPLFVAGVRMQLLLIRERSKEAKWAQIALYLLDATEAEKAHLVKAVQTSRKGYEETDEMRLFLSDFVKLLHLLPEDRDLADEWTQITAEMQQLALAWCDLMDALLGRVEGLAPEVIARARKLRFQAAKNDVFDRHSDLLQRLA